MQYLERIDSRDDATLYAIGGDYAGAVARYVVTTPEGRTLCNRPEIMGVEFGTMLTRAVTRALRVLPEREAILAHPEQRVCVAHFLRGGLNFGIREALHHAHGLNLHSSCFMSSQRRRVDGRWQVEEDMYRKLRIPDQAILLFGDVVATGITVSNGLQVMIEHMRRIGSSVRRIVFFTIGCHKLEKVLVEHDAQLRDAFPDYEGASAVYLEGKFRLVDGATELRIGIPGTDLVRRDCLVAPEFALSQYEALDYPLERCVIYDAGSRAFDIPAYVEDVREYWEQVRALGEQGFTLTEALEERWPEPWREDRAAFRAALAERWRGLVPALGDRIWERMQERWTEPFRSRAATPEALVELAEARLQKLPAVTR